jgi:hypothetical protein
VREHAAAAGRDEAQIERAIDWPGTAAADDYAAEGVTLHTSEIHPTDDGYHLAPLKELLAWRDDRR